MKWTLLVGLFLQISSGFAPVFGADPSVFPLKNGDVWVMAGDSITAQHLHSNYFEAFCFARYPQWKFAFRNSGVGGHTIPSTLARFDYDVAAWKPTVVSVELGMNDQGGTATEKFIANMKTMVDRIRSTPARPVILSASPINNGATLARLGGNQRLNDYAIALKSFAADEKIPYADQFHALIDVWGQNKPSENLANLLGPLGAVVNDDSVTGVKHLREFLAAQKSDPHKPVSMQGDAVHPGPNGQLMMAAALLKELGADGFVSSVTIVDGKVDTKGCRVDDLQATNNGYVFDRLDERLPFPIPDGTVEVLPLFPVIEELSQYLLTVKGLSSTPYTISVNGQHLGTLTRDQLSAGVNLTALIFQPPAKPDAANALVKQSREILNAVAQKEGLVNQWRGLSRNATADGASAELKTQLVELTKKIEEADERIREAARPQKLRFTIMPTNM
ncbi:MAG: hypothetical protein JSS49_05435 [Planctomycetes bacterium]|nr:hypothetical protein [Planctomycetota bacterium]